MYIDQKMTIIIGSHGRCPLVRRANQPDPIGPAMWYGHG